MAVPSLMCPYLLPTIALLSLPAALFPQNTKGRNCIAHGNVSFFLSPFSTLYSVTRTSYILRLQTLVAKEFNPHYTDVL